MKKRILRAVLCAAMALGLLALAGCSGNEEGARLTGRTQASGVNVPPFGEHGSWQKIEVCLREAA